MKIKTKHPFTFACIFTLQGALLGLLGRPDNQGEDTPETVMVARRQLNRQLLKFTKIYVAKCKYSLVDRYVTY